MISSSDVPYEGVFVGNNEAADMCAAHFGRLHSALQQVPQLQEAFNAMDTDSAILNTAVQRNLGQAALLADISDLNSDDYDWSSRAKALWVSGVWGSASDVSAAELHDTAQDHSINLTHVALQSLAGTDATYMVVMDRLLGRLMGGSKLALTGAIPQDGDPRFDVVIWGHTLITDRDSLLAFVGAHFTCMYVAETLMAAGVTNADQKDYAISAMIDIAIMRGLRHPDDTIYKLWSSPKPNAYGWVSTDRLRAFEQTRQT